MLISQDNFTGLDDLSECSKPFMDRLQSEFDTRLSGVLQNLGELEVLPSKKMETLFAPREDQQKLDVQRGAPISR